MSPRETPAAAAVAAAAMLQHLEPGPLAELRRMDRETGAPAFWRLAAKHPDTIGRQDKQEQWMEIIRIFAILTPKGDPVQRPPLYDRGRRLGEMLCDGGDPSWPKDGGTPRPMFSEQRLAQLMAARETQRGVLLARAARALARSRVPDSGVNVVDIAMVLLNPEEGRQLAKPYYRRLDRAELAVKESEKGAIQ